MTVEKALAEIERCLGTQFDEHIGRIFISSNIYELWDILQYGFSKMCENASFTDYGALAVGTLIK